MIITKLTGGIGNQMFQYATGRRLAIKNNAELKLDITHYDNHIMPDGLPYRSYDLPVFMIDEKIATKREIELFKNTSQSYFKRGFKKIRNLVDPHIEIIEPYFHFNPGILDLKGSFYLDGYWQCEKYFIDIEDIVRKEFRIKTTITTEGEDLLQKIKSTNSVCLNVRRQEFATNRHVNQFVGKTYLDNAISLMAGKISDPHFYIVSDDLPWCKENIKLNYPHTFIEEHLYGDKFRDCLFFMTSCKHFIIPNSTFGWWAAWLSSNSEKIVIAPEKWLNDPKRNTKDVIPDKWIKI
jgi:hypothetical protein